MCLAKICLMSDPLQTEKRINQSKACLVILVLFKSAESLFQKQPFKCSPNHKSCQANPEGAFHAIPRGVGSPFSDVVCSVGMGWCSRSRMALQPPFFGRG